MAHFLSSLSLLVAACAFPDTAIHPPRHLVGEWGGTAKVVGTMMLDRTFTVRIQIHRDGTVTGVVGDSTLTNAQFYRHRPVSVSRKERRDLMDYMISGQLSGPLLVRQHVSAPQVFIPLDYNEGRF